MSVNESKSPKEGKQTKEAKNDVLLKPEDITKNFKSLTEDQIALALVTPSLAPTLLGVFTKLSEEQMKAAFRFMSPDQIKTTVPKLQVLRIIGFIFFSSNKQAWGCQLWTHLK